MMKLKLKYFLSGLIAGILVFGIISYLKDAVSSAGFSAGDLEKAEQILYTYDDSVKASALEEIELKYDDAELSISLFNASAKERKARIHDENFYKCDMTLKRVLGYNAYVVKILKRYADRFPGGLDGLLRAAKIEYHPYDGERYDLPSIVPKDVEKKFNLYMDLLGFRIKELENCSDEWFDARAGTIGSIFRNYLPESR